MKDWADKKEVFASIENERPSEEGGWRVKRSIDEIEEEEEDLFQQHDRAFRAYDCSQPADIQVMRNSEAALCDKEPELRAQKNRTFILAQKATKVHFTARRCSIETTTVPS